MIIQLLSLLLFFPLILFAVTPQELLSLHQQAEAALQKKEYTLAAEYYKNLIDCMTQPTSVKISWQEYIDGVIRYAEILLELDEWKEAEKVLSDLLRQKPPQEYHSSIKLARARTQRGTEGTMRAYREMREVEKEQPLSLWPAEMRLFFHTLEITLNDYFDGLLQKAERLSLSKENRKALSCYQEIENGIEREVYPKAMQEGSLLPKKVRLALAKIHYQLADYEQTLCLTKKTKSIEDSIDCNLLCLAAKAHTKTKEYQEAITLLEQQLAKQRDRRTTDEYLRALYELAYIYSKAGNLLAAKERLEQIVKTAPAPTKISLYALSALAELYLEEGNHIGAERALIFLSQEKKCDPLLVGKRLFLQGQLEIARGNYHAAIPYLKQALPTLRRRAALSLAHSYLACHCELDEAEKYLISLLKGDERREALLMLAFLYQQKGESEKSRMVIEENFSSLNLEAKLLLAEDATDEIYLHCSGYAHAWFCHALRELEKKEYSSAIASLEMANTLLEDPPRSPLLSLIYRKDLKRAESLQLDLKKDNEEASYIEALLSAYCRKEGVIVLFQELLGGKYHEQALFMIGSHYYQQGEFDKAKNCFIALSQSELKNDLTRSALYWAAESEEELEPSSQRVAEFRQQFIQETKDLSFGAEAYFKCYPMDDYVKGLPRALEHLKPFTTLFPHSTLCIAASYLLALHERELNNKEKLLEESLIFYDHLPPHRQQQGAFYFRAKALLLLAEINKSNPHRVILLLKPLLRELQKEERFSFLQEKDGICLLREECRLVLARAYIQDRKYYKAQRLLFDVTQAHATCGIERGYFLALAWAEQAHLAFMKSNFSLALESYDVALQCGEGFFSEEEKVALWLKQSDCRLQKKRQR